MIIGIRCRVLGLHRRETLRDALLKRCNSASNLAQLRHQREHLLVELLAFVLGKAQCFFKPLHACRECGDVVRRRAHRRG